MDSQEYLAKMIADLPIVEQFISTGIPRGVAMYLSVPQRDVVVEALKRHAQGRLEPRLAERLTDVVMMLDTPDAYNREYIAAVCRSILSSLSSTDGGGK